MKKKKIAFNDVKNTFRWYWKLTKQHNKWLWLLAVTYGLGTICAEIISVVIYKKIIDALALPEKDLELIWYLGFILLGVYFTFYVCFRLGERFNRIYQVRTMEDLSYFAFSHLQKHSYDFFSNRFAGSITSQAKRFIDSFTNISETLVFNYWLNFIQLVGIISVIWFYAWQAALLLVCALTCIVIGVIPLVRKKMEYDAKEAEEDSLVTGHFSDVISNILTTKIFTSSKFEENRFRSHIEKQMSVLDSSYRTYNLLAAVQNGLILVTRLALLFVGIYLWSSGKITAGTIVLIFSYSQVMFSMAWQLVRSSSHMLRSFANAKEMIEIFETPLEIADSPHSKKFQVTQGEILFKEVGFSYKDGGEVFKDFSLRIRPGERVGLVGPSGGGKTTITKLLLRFIDTQEGSICIDGQNITEIRQDDLRRSIAYVPQDPTLFHRSLFDNIVYGKPGATKNEVIEAAKKAHAHEFIESLEKGYDTEVGERGVKLSGGQRQRIAIARAILKDAPILVMDEATSALDTISERAIRDSLDAMMANKTVMIIAHRLSTVEKLDRIIVLDKNGTIKEQGTHQELLNKNGLYATLWNHQVGGFLSEDDEK